MDGSNQPNVKIRKSGGKKARPGKQHVVFVEVTAQLPGRVPRAPGSNAGKAIKLAADQVPQRVTGKSIEGEKDNVGQHDQTAHTDAEAMTDGKRANAFMSCRKVGSDGIPAIRERKCPNGVIPKEADKDKSKIKSVTVQVLQNEGEAGFTPVIAGLFANSPCWRIPEETTLVGLPLVVHI